MTGTELRRSLGLPALLFYGVGLILGAGIYSVIGAAAGHAGSGLWLSFLVGAAVSLLTGLSYAELATTYPRAGAEYVYARRAFPERPGAASVVGLVLVLASAATATTVALAFAGYLHALVDAPRGLVALALLIVVTIVNVVGLRASTWFNIVFTLIEAGGLVLIICLGAADAEFGDAIAVTPDAGILAGAAMVFFAYLGFEDLANLVEETRNPERRMPQAIMISIAITAVLYVLVALAVVALVPPDRLAATDSPLAVAAATAGPKYPPILSAIALFATANTALVTLLAASRMIFGMAREGDLPADLARLGKRNTPGVAAVVVFVVAVALLPLGGVAVVAGLSSFAALLAFAAVNVSLITLRIRDPKRPRPFRVPFAVGGVPVLAALGVLSSLLLVTQFDAPVYVAGGIALALAAAIVAIQNRRRGSAGR